MSRHIWLFAAVLLGCPHGLPADIFRWDNGQLIPGTEGIRPAPGMDVSGWNTPVRNLNYADFSGGVSLSNARFTESWLRSASFDHAMLLSADFHGADLTGARLTTAILVSADLTQANLGQANLARATFTLADLTDANLTEADLTGAYLAGDVTGPPAILTGADFTDAVVTRADFGAGFWANVKGWMTKEQLYSTANYKAKDLSGVGVSGIDLAGEDLSGFNLAGARLGLEANLSDIDFTRANLAGASFAGYPTTAGSFRPGANLSGANFTDSVIAGVDFSGTQGFTTEQLYSTSSYQSNDLGGITFAGDLSGCNLSGRDLSATRFTTALLTGANLSQANLTRASFSGYSWGVPGPSLENADLSYANLTSANFSAVDLTNANLRQAELIGAEFRGVDALRTNLSGANLLGANLSDARITAVFSTETIYNQWTVFPDDFDPLANGLTFRESPRGDFNSDGILNDADIDALATRIRLGDSPGPGHWPDAMFDANNDSQVDLYDHLVWVHNLKQTWFGDANLDGEFNPADLTTVLGAGEYEDDIVANSGWASGDWDGNGDFTSADLVVALAEGGYQQESQLVLWQNTNNALDVDANLSIEPVDVLLVIQRLNQDGSRLLPWHSSFAVHPPPYYDVNGDAYISPADAMLVINALNGRLVVVPAEDRSSASFVPEPSVFLLVLLGTFGLLRCYEQT